MPRRAASPARRADLRESHIPGRTFGSAYRSIIGPSPVCAPDDRQAALAFVRRLERALGYEGRWTHAERRRLREQRVKWQRRADGLDVRFELFGTQPGRLDATTEHRVQILQHMRDTNAALPGRK